MTRKSSNGGKSGATEIRKDLKMAPSFQAYKEMGCYELILRKVRNSVKELASKVLDIGPVLLVIVPFFQAKIIGASISFPFCISV